MLAMSNLEKADEPRAETASGGNMEILFDDGPEIGARSPIAVSDLCGCREQRQIAPVPLRTGEARIEFELPPQQISQVR